MQAVLTTLLSFALLLRPAYSQTYNDGQWQPTQTTAWYQPTSYVTYYSTHPYNGQTITITSTVPCPPVSTVIEYTTDCPDYCCYDNDCCRNQFGGTCWATPPTLVYGTTTRTIYTTTTPGQQQNNQNQYLRTTTSAGTVYVIVESGAANNGQQVAVVQGGAESLGGGIGSAVTALVAGGLVVGMVMVLL